METAHRAVATDDRRLTQTPYRTVYCGGFFVLGGFHKRSLVLSESVHSGVRDYSVTRTH
jgi:hypothetical protein